MFNLGHLISPMMLGKSIAVPFLAVIGVSAIALGLVSVLVGADNGIAAGTQSCRPRSLL